MTDHDRPKGSVIPLDDLEHTAHSHEFVGAEHGEAHGFTNTGQGELRLTAIHGGSRFNTEWLAGPDPTWTSKPKG